jgi:hypothetical protein
MTGPPSPARALVFGISGATWSVVRPLMRAGKMPNLRRLMENGCSATLHSVRVQGDKHYRPQVAWATVATGCLPQHHGITAFYHTSDDYRRPCIWDTFQAHHRSVGLFYWPITWPPGRANGFIVPCYHARDDSTWPPELASLTWLDRARHEAQSQRDGPSRRQVIGSIELAWSMLRNGLRAASLPYLGATACELWRTKDRERRALLSRHAKAEIHADLFLRLYGRYRPHLATFHTFLVDYVSHRYWRYRDPEAFGEPRSARQERLGSAVDESYQRTDKVLGRILERTSPDTVIAVLSEHGMSPEPVSSELGPWQYVIDGRSVAALAGLSKLVTSCPIARWVAFRPLPDRPMPKDATRRLRAITVVETGLPLFSVYENGEREVVVKLSIHRSVPRYASGDLDTLNVECEGRNVSLCTLVTRGARQRSAMHDAHGMLILCGPGIRSGVTLPDASITAFAPTLLRCVGLPREDGMDGAELDVLQS